MNNTCKKIKKQRVYLLFFSKYKDHGVITFESSQIIFSSEKKSRHENLEKNYNDIIYLWTN